MSRRIPTKALAASVTLAFCALPALADGKLARKVEAAAEVYLELLETPERSVPRRLLEEARCVAVIPHVIKGAVGVGGHHGKGVMSCRNDVGRWSPPVFLELSGGSFGFQIGVSATDVALFFMNERGVRSLLRSKFTLGADAGVAAGPAGRTAEASTDLKLKAEIYSYAKSRGLFAGISLEGGRLATDDVATRRYYGRRLRAEKILFEHEVPTMPAEAVNLVRLLERED